MKILQYYSSNWGLVTHPVEEADTSATFFKKKKQKTHHFYGKFHKLCQYIDITQFYHVYNY